MRTSLFSLLFWLSCLVQASSLAQDQSGTGTIVCIGAGSAIPWQGVNEISIQLAGTGPERVMTVQTFPDGASQAYSAKLISDPPRQDGQTFLGAFGEGLTDRQAVTQSGGPGGYPYDVVSFASGKGAKLWIDSAVANGGQGVGTFFYLSPASVGAGTHPYRHIQTRFFWNYFSVVCTSNAPEPLPSAVPAPEHQEEGVNDGDAGLNSSEQVQGEESVTRRQSISGLLSRLSVTTDMLDQSMGEGAGFAKFGTVATIAAVAAILLRRTPQGLAASIAMPPLPGDDSVQGRIEALSAQFTVADLSRYLRASQSDALEMLNKPGFKEFIYSVESYLNTESFNRSLTEEI